MTRQAQRVRSKLMSRVEKVGESLTRRKRELVPLAKSVHGIDRLTPTFSFFFINDQLFSGDGIQSEFDDFFGRSPQTACEGDLDDLGAVRRKGDLHTPEA